MDLWQWFLEPVNQRLVFGVVIAFIIGLVIGGRARRLRGKSRGHPLSGSRGDEAFFRGFQYILSNDHDHAIEEFTKSVQMDSDTVETYVALGNLYRSRGDIDRAIRIRQSIILRPNIDEEIKLRALFDLGLDYRKGGFLNRALKTFQQVTQKNPSNVEALGEMERIYEELKDWENAYRTRQAIARLTKENYQNVLAHHLVEWGKVHQQKGDVNKAISLFNKAMATDRQCVDAYLHLGDLYFNREDYKKALSTWKKAVSVVPQFTFLVYRRLEGAYSRMQNLKPVEEFLKDIAQKDSDAFTHLALARYLYTESDIDGALKELENALQLAPSLWEARKLKGEILLNQGRDKEALREYGMVLERLHMPYLKFQCAHCGFAPNDLQWQCPQCKQWDTIHRIDSGEAREESEETEKHPEGSPQDLPEE